MRCPWPALSEKEPQTWKYAKSALPAALYHYLEAVAGAEIALHVGATRALSPSHRSRASGFDSNTQADCSPNAAMFTDDAGG